MSPEGQQILVGEYLEVPLEDHPIAEIFPLLPDEELEELSRDIEEKGLRSPIMIHEGKILDGRNRYRAIKLMPSWSGKLDLWWLTKYLGPDPVEYVISVNHRRRHLTYEQCVAAAAELANMSQGERTDLSEPSANWRKVSQNQAAELFKVSERSVQRAVALRRASSGKFEEFKSGKISLNAALRAVKPDPVPTPEHPRSWTVPEKGENHEQSESAGGEQQLEQLEKLGTLHAELSGIVKMIEAAQRSAKAGLLEFDEFRGRLIRIRDHINNQIENLT